MSTDPVKAIAEAVLYEGYILWPYRRSALKNQRRFTFGGVYPPAHAAVHPDDPCVMRAEMLMRGEAQLEVTVRFLQVVRRTVLGPDGEPVDERVLDGELLQSWEEAIEREIAAPAPIAIAAGAQRDGAQVRSWERLDGAIEVVRGSTPRRGVRRVTVTVRNLTAFAGGSRQEALKRTLCSTHILLKATPPGGFISLTDPPAGLADEAAACRNIGCWPVLVGQPGDASSMLASPIILEDHPRIAPESPGDMFDAGEIDQLLVLNIMSLTDAEQAEMAASDPRAAQILERVQRLTPEQLLRLHGRTALR